MLYKHALAEIKQITVLPPWSSLSQLCLYNPIFQGAFEEMFIGLSLGNIRLSVKIGLKSVQNMTCAYTPPTAITNYMLALSIAFPFSPFSLQHKVWWRLRPFTSSDKLLIWYRQKKPNMHEILSFVSRTYQIAAEQTIWPREILRGPFAFCRGFFHTYF